MTGLGTIVNIGAILAGCLVGMLLKGGLPKRLQDTISSAVGLCVVFVGITGGIKGLMTMSGSGFETRDTLVTVVCMVAGAALGEWINIEYKLEQLGDWCKSRSEVRDFYRGICQLIPAVLRGRHGNRGFTGGRAQP